MVAKTVCTSLLVISLLLIKSRFFREHEFKVEAAGPRLFELSTSCLLAQMYILCLQGKN